VNEEERLDCRPRISIVTCSLNQGRFLESTIRSVLAQEYPALEYIIVDGGSTDGSVEIIKRYDRRLAWWVSEPDAGQTDALIKGFHHSTGEIMGWLCSDDLLMPGALRTVSDSFARNQEMSVLFGDAVWIDEADHLLGYKREIGFQRFVWLWSHNYLPQPSTFWKREIYERSGGLDRSFDLAMDGDLWERFSQRTKIYHIPRVLSLLRRYPLQKNARLRRLSNLEDHRYRARSLGRPPLPMEVPLKRLTARMLRVGLKILNGCYARRPPQEVSEYLATIRRTA
jgi:glycosyltransferase involved in cell wall biosynthesis